MLLGAFFVFYTTESGPPGKTKDAKSSFSASFFIYNKIFKADTKMSEKVRLRSLGEKVNLTLFHEIVGFILETASATLEQTRDLANR